MQFKGTPASPGISFGKVLILKHQQPVVEKKQIQDINSEIGRFESALVKTKLELEKIRVIALEKLGQSNAAIFESHLLVLEDPELVDQTINTIKHEQVNCDWAFSQIAQQFISIFENMEDEYLRERASDVKDVSSRVINHLFGIQQHDLSLIDEKVILVTHDLTPSQTATMNKEMVIGFLTNIGGKTSHSAIMARNLEIPAVVGLHNLTDLASNNDHVLFDGSTGEVYLNPSHELIESFNQKNKLELVEKEKLKSLIGTPSITLDGHHVELAGNIGSPNDVDSLIRNDAEAIGLYRTEFVFMDRETMPSEDEQFEYYSKVLINFKKPTIIRTLDIGGDKQLDYLHIGEEMNPFLGYRAIRICLREKEIFKTQLRALLRASYFGPLSIMFPMISSLEEFLEAKNIFEEVKNELRNKEQSVCPNIKIGIMIEIPSAALISDILAEHVDFFSIGTNDLTQYTCAVDRMNEKISHLYNPYSPGLLRLINLVIKNGKAKNKMVGICGSMAHQKELVPLFLGMGLHEFSMSPMHILSTRKIIQSLNYKECKELANNVLSLGTAIEVELALTNFLKQKLN
jgi:phosphotransferase system enzyme I (PtsI)